MSPFGHPLLTTLGRDPAPAWLLDLTAYPDTDAMVADRANRRQWESGKKWVMSDDRNVAVDNAAAAGTPTGLVSLQTSLDVNPPNGATRAMRYLYGALGAQGKNYNIGRKILLPTPDAVCPEGWLDLYVRVSRTPAFETDNPEINNNPDWKFSLWYGTGGRSRWEWNLGNGPGHRCVGGYPYQETLFGGAGWVWRSLTDGNWHRCQMHCKGSSGGGFNPDGRAVAYFDGRVVFDLRNVVTKVPTFDRISIGDTFNEGPDASHLGMWAEFADRIAFYTSDPGWGF